MNEVIRKNNWDFYHKGQIDQERHKQKVKKAIRENLSDLIGEETLIYGKEKVAVNIKSLNEYKIIFQDKDEQNVGMGNGDAQKGDMFSNGKEAGAGQGMGAGQDSGVDWYESDVDIEEIKEELFSEMELPDLSEKKQKNRMLVDKFEYKDIRKKGIKANIHKKRTILNSLKRTGELTYPQSIENDDIVYKTWEEVEKPETSAVVFALMDVSGSMGMWEKYTARTFYFWAKKFLESKYDNVEIVYIGHHTEAKVQTEEEFFTKGESGGTICSSAYRLMAKLIEEEYHPSEYNIYGFHVSDGDNLVSDNARCVKLLTELSKDLVTFNYLEVNQYSRHSTLYSAYQHIKLENYKECIVKQRSGIYEALKTFFPKGKE